MKKYLIIGNQNAITYKEIFPLIKDNKMWLGISTNGSNRWFRVPNNYIHRNNAAGYKEQDGKKYLFVNGIMWFTNLDHSKRHEKIDLYKHYNPEEYPKYDNYDAIEVSKVCEIPMDYEEERIVTEDELIKLKEQGFDVEIIEEYKIKIKNPVMGVPITFIDKYCHEQFEIIGLMSGVKHDVFINGDDGRAKFYINGKGVYARILIRIKK